MTGTDAAELALQALLDSQRDAAWLADAALDDAMKRALSDGWGAAMQLADKAIAVRNAIAERLAVIQPMITAVIAEREQSDRAADLAVTH